MPQPHFTPGKDPVPILQEAGWAPGPVWMGGKSRPHSDSILDRPARSQSLYRLTYLAHKCMKYLHYFTSGPRWYYSFYVVNHNDEFILTYLGTSYRCTLGVFCCSLHCRIWTRLISLCVNSLCNFMFVVTFTVVLKLCWYPLVYVNRRWLLQHGKHILYLLECKTRFFPPKFTDRGIRSFDICYHINFW